MKKRLIPLLLALLLLTPCASSVHAASGDQPSLWATGGINQAKELNLVTDEMNRNFQFPTTRAEFCRLIVNMLIIWYDAPIDFQIEARGLTPLDFNDLTGVDWPYAIRAAAALGITNGTGNGNFSPDAVLTREQAAGMLRNTMNALGMDTANPANAAWADKADIAVWAREAVDVMYAAKIMSGTNSNPLTFSSKTPYTHEQAVITVLRLWEYAASQNVSRTLPEGNVDYGKPTTTAPTQPVRQYDMNDPNVQKHPIYATARTLEEFRAGVPSRWRSAADIIENTLEQSKDPENWIDGVSNYEYRLGPVTRWLDQYLNENGLTYADKTDFEKTAIIKRIIEEGRLEELIGVWEPGFSFSAITSGHCAYYADAIKFLMTAMDFEFFDIVSGPFAGVVHGWNAYWDSTVSAVRFLDGQFIVWNVYVDELDEKRLLLD